MAIDPGKWDLSLDRLRAVAARLGNPELAIPSIVVGGSNGKGSVVAYLSSVLCARDEPAENADFAAGALVRDLHEEDVATAEHHELANRCRRLNSPEISAARFLLETKGTAPPRVGSFVKPHIFTIRERVRINGDPVSEAEFARAAEIAFAACDESGEKLTYFELTFLIAALAFREMGAEIAVYEVGLGGRFDAVNICRPFLSVITNIGADHQRHLGRSASDQAREKAGIIPESGIVVWGGGVAREAVETTPDAARRDADTVIAGAAAERGSFLLPAFKTFQHVRYDYGFNRQKVSMIMQDLAALYGRPVYENERVFSIDQMGSFQCANLDCVFTAVLALKALGFNPGFHRWRTGLYRTKYRGRFEHFTKDGMRAIVDCAHNPDGLRSLRASITMYQGPLFRFDPEKMKVPVIFTCQQGKDVGAMLCEIAPVARCFFATSVNVLKPMPAKEIVRLAGEAGISVEAAKSPADAIARAEKTAGPQGTFLICGSVYSLSAFIEELERKDYKSAQARG
jgi:dihydrofolate synthase/folylpolyglutamate synthase